MRFELTSVRDGYDICHRAPTLAPRYFEIITGLGYAGEIIATGNPTPGCATQYYVEVPGFEDLARIVAALEPVADADFQVILTLDPDGHAELEIYDYFDE
jgi:hypothetical protein